MKPSFPIATVISYCTNDDRFLDRCIAEAMQFSSQVLVVVCDHFFDGTLENRTLLQKAYARNRDCLFLELSYLENRLYSRYHSLTPQDPEWPAFWAATTRYAGLHYLDQKCEWVLFLDSDEIVEAVRFLDWIEKGGLHRYTAQRLGSYLYALLPTLRSRKWVSLPLLVRKDTLAPLTLLNSLERIGAYQSHFGPKREKVVGSDGRPFVHHYSWVRTKEECRQKGRTWSHRHEQDWNARIEEAFSGKPERLFEYTAMQFENTAAYFDPFKERREERLLSLDFSHVRKINDQDLFIRELEFY